MKTAKTVAITLSSSACSKDERFLKRKSSKKSTSGRVDEWTSGQVDEWTSGRVDKWTRVQVDEGTSGRGYKWTRGEGALACGTRSVAESNIG